MVNISQCFRSIFHKASGTFALTDSKSVQFSGKESCFFFLACSIFTRAEDKIRQMEGKKSVKELQHQNLLNCIVGLKTENINCVASASKFQEVLKMPF